ncbi:MAG: PD-(D/E)XK nuclease family protein [Coleofasciculaceae cyanobacterium]
MDKKWRLYTSYNLWLQFSPALGKEHWHCDMKRGFSKARNREPQVSELLDPKTTPIGVGLLAQQGVYEFHQNPMMLYQTDAVEKAAQILQLNNESEAVQERVISILTKYKANPVLLGKNIVELNRGDEGVPKPILIEHGNYQLNILAAMDCIFREKDGTLHILDFKTGKSKFDRRQAYVYLLAASHLYPQQKYVASFYNLETCQWSEQITATPSQLEAICIELVRITQRHQKDLISYKEDKADFNRIFPPNPGSACRYCPFNSICDFSTSEAST